METDTCFDDGVHTYIQFSGMMASTDMLVLFVLRGRTNELVNYRYQSPYFNVCRLPLSAIQWVSRRDFSMLKIYLSYAVM